MSKPTRPLEEILPKCSEAFDKWMTLPKNRKLGKEQKDAAQSAFFAAWSAMLEVLHTAKWQDYRE